MMKTIQSFFSVVLFLILPFSLSSQGKQTVSRAVASEMCKGDNVLRFYRIAMPVTYSCFNENFSGDKAEVTAFWHSVEEFMNSVYAPIGFCFDVVEDNRLVMNEINDIDNNSMNALGFGTELLNALIGSENYDVGIWIALSADWDNKGQSVVGGVYKPSNKAAGYATKDLVTVAHEVGHLFGALHTNDPGTHTEAGLGQSVMGYGSPADFFSLPSVEQIYSWNREYNASYYSDEARTKLVGDNSGGNYVYGVKVDNSAPAVDDGSIADYYRIPTGACFAFDIAATDADGDIVTYAVQPADDGTPFCAFAPSQNSVVDYRPMYTLFDNDDYFYIVDGTDVTTVAPGRYNFYVGVNDLPDVCSHDALKANPFYSTYSVYTTVVEFVDGTPFTAKLTPAQHTYQPGDKVMVEWGVNDAVFTADSKVRISLSDDYGKTFKYLLAESVPARAGKCHVEIPNVKIGDVGVEFGSVIHTLPAGIIRVDMVDGIAYTLTTLSPTDESGTDVVGGFNVDGTTASVDDGLSVEAELFDVYDIYGRVIRRSVSDVGSLSPGIYVINGEKVLVR